MEGDVLDEEFAQNLLIFGEGKLLVTHSVVL
jgi:hypothetical protein